jgi:multidrug efflux pump subunit AcrB
MGFVRFALRFPHTFYVLAALILFLGITAIRAMPTDIFPEISIPVVTVIWQETGLSVAQVRDGSAVQQNIVRADGRRSVLLSGLRMHWSRKMRRSEWRTRTTATGVDAKRARHDSTQFGNPGTHAG